MRNFYKILFIAILLTVTSGECPVLAQSKGSSLESPKSIKEILEGEEAIIEFDIPADILNNLDKNPANIKRPSNSGTVAGGSNTQPHNNSSGTSRNNAIAGNNIRNNASPGSNVAHGNTPGTASTNSSKPTLRKMEGFRIQVFSDGRNPSTLQARAKARGNAIVAKFPKYRGQVYSFSSSPNWYTRIGNFETSKEASAALAELKRAFPSFAGEMRIVKSPITIVK